jgi:hypothetical protein
MSKYARDLRVLGAWGPLLVAAILLLLIGADITAGRAADPAIIGHAYLALFVVGLVATLFVRGRRGPMSYICVGLAAAYVAFGVVCYVLRYIALTVPVLVITALIAGALGAAGWLFRVAPFPPGERS